MPHQLAQKGLLHCQRGYRRGQLKQEIKKDIEIIFFVEKFTKCGRRCRDEGREVSCRDEGRVQCREIGREVTVRTPGGLICGTLCGTLGGLICGTLCGLFGGLRKRLNGL